MKYLNNIIIGLLTLVFFYSCGSENDRNQLRWTGKNDTLELSMIVGSNVGGKKYTIANKKDRGKYVARLLSSTNQYKSEFYSKLTVEFNGDLLTYVDSAKMRQIIAPYQFKKDSLFALKSDGKKLFVNLGDTTNQYSFKTNQHRYLGAWRTKINKVGTSPTPIIDNEGKVNYEMSEQDMLKISGFNSISEITNEKDTLIWVNVKYYFN